VARVTETALVPAGERLRPESYLRAAAAGLVGAGALWPVVPHPPLTCPLRALTGIPCPLCGMTRACVAALHGHVAASLAFNPAGLLVVVAALLALVRPQWLTRVRLPVGLVVAAGAALWLWNVGFNPTFHQLLLR
jgi:uncharacterized protein DUF2752